MIALVSSAATVVVTKSGAAAMAFLPFTAVEVQLTALTILVLLQTCALGAIVAVQQLQLRKLRHLIEQLAMLRADRGDRSVFFGPTDAAGDSK